MTQAANQLATPAWEHARRNSCTGGLARKSANASTSTSTRSSIWSLASTFLCLPMIGGAIGGALGGALLLASSAAFAQSSSNSPKPVSDMTVEELANYVKEQEMQLEAVRQARDAQKAKADAVQEALLDRQEKLNQIVIELSELCSQRKELDPDDTEPCLPEES